METAKFICLSRFNFVERNNNPKGSVWDFSDFFHFVKITIVRYLFFDLKNGKFAFNLKRLSESTLL